MRELTPDDDDDLPEDDVETRLLRSSWLRYRRRDVRPVYDQPAGVEMPWENHTSWMTGLLTWRQILEAKRNREVGDHYRALYTNRRLSPPIEIDAQFGRFLVGSGLADLGSVPRSEE